MGKDFTNNPSLPRGIRNNNPANIRSTSIKWKGQIGQDSAGFVIFSNMDYGIRAFGMDITSKVNRGLDTLTKIINVYAPPSENNTVAYINSVSKSTGISPTQKITADRTTLAALARGFFNVENGSQGNLITMQDILNGLRLMGGNSPLPISGIPILIIIIVLITFTYLIFNV